MEGKDVRGAEYKRRRKQWWEGSEICKKRHCNSLNHICNHFQSIYTRTYLLGLCRWQIYLDNSNPFLFDYLLKSILTLKSFIRAKFSNPFSTNSFYWAYWAWIQSYLRPRIKTRPYNWHHLWGGNFVIVSATGNYGWIKSLSAGVQGVLTTGWFPEFGTQERSKG